MTLRTSPWPAGVPCWADLTVPDVPTAQAFYSAVLGWSFGEPDPAFGGYAIAEVRGEAAAGIGPIQMPGQPTAWTLYLASDDAEKTEAAITEHGGTIVMPTDDVGPMGRLAIAVDPTGAAFGVWQAKEMIGAAIVNEPGGLTWEDLRTTDPDTARTFYAGVFGYDFQSMPGAPDGYQMFTSTGEEAPLGGIGPMMHAGEGAAHWLAYFGVADCAAAVAAAESAGGTLTMAAFDSPYGRMAGLADPFGAAFWVVQVPPAAD